MGPIVLVQAGTYGRPNCPVMVIDGVNVDEKFINLHEQDMENPDRRTNTTLARHVWRLKDKGENPTIRMGNSVQSSTFLTHYKNT